MDILVIGAGPAGLAASAYLARAGLRVGCLAPEHPSPWPNNYGLWEDEIVGFGVEDCWERRWETPVVYTDTGQRRQLERVYLRLDNVALRTRLLDWCEANGVEWLEGTAEAIEIDETGASVYTSGGQAHRATMIVEATGHNPRFVQREDGGPSAFQAAYGVVARFEDDPIGGDELVLMDFRDEFLSQGIHEHAPPTFLYAMHLDGEGRYLVEETSLAARPAVSFDALEKRLSARLAARKICAGSVEEVERCLIPMNSPLPLLDQRVVGFGAAASMVHPATGYQMATMLRTAPELAETVAHALGGDAASPVEAARLAWETIWPRERLRAHKMWLFGLDCLLGLDAAGTREFFEAFFSLPEAQWQGYMSGTLGYAEIARAMWSLFRLAPMSLRVELGRMGVLRLAGI